MGAFDTAWNLLKAVEADQGMLGTTPQPILQALRRLEMMRQQDPEGFAQMFPEGTPQPPRPDVQGAFRGVERDVSGLADDVETQLMARDAQLRGADPVQSMTAEEIERLRQNPEAYNRAIRGYLGTVVPGYETMPEESFYTPLEQYQARGRMSERMSLGGQTADATEQSLRRLLGGAQAGGTMAMRGGGRSGVNAPMSRYQRDIPKEERQRRLDRAATDLGRQQGVAVGGKLGRSATAFTQQPTDAPQFPLTAEQRQAIEMFELMGGKVDEQGNPVETGAMEFPDLEGLLSEKERERRQKATESFQTPRGERLETTGRAARAAEMIDRSKVMQGQRPNLGIPQDPRAQAAFSGDPEALEQSRAATEAAMERSRAMRLGEEIAQRRRQLMEQGREAQETEAARQAQIDQTS